jgi:carbon monoxide dehydrogenase subunit G
MEHESFLPVPAPRAVAALRTPGAVAAALPGWQPDAGTGAGTAGRLRGRLRLRVGGSTVTYRGTVSIEGTGPVFTVTAEGTEVRGAGTVSLAAEVTVAAVEVPEPGAALMWRGTADADGRLAAYEAAVVQAAVRRLLDRFAAGLAEHEAEAADDEGASAGDGAAADDIAEDVSEDAPEDTAGDSSEEPDVVDDLGEPAPPAELDDFELVEVEVPESAAALDDLVPPAEAAHARRTMIGRSAEEVDHAPPRGRYAPVPAPDSSSAAAALRWAAPAAAALVASAVVVGRVLRRRR